MWRDVMYSHFSFASVLSENGKDNTDYTLIQSKWYSNPLILMHMNLIIMTLKVL